MADKVEKDELPNTESKKMSEPVPEFYVAGIGASAGGLESFEKFFRHIEPHTPDPRFPIAFVVISHLEKTKTSILPSILQKYTLWPVLPIEENMMIEAGHVYVAPAGYAIVIRKDQFHMEAQDSHLPVGQSINTFLISLAQEMQERAIGVVLSGMGKDGTEGLIEIKNRGGLVIAQEPLTASFGSMPIHAVESGVIDLVLPPEIMPAQIVEYILSQLKPNAPLPPEIAEKNNIPELEQILRLIYNHTKNDFFAYKKNTLLRRIQKRMSLHHIDSLKHYAQYLQKNEDEIEKLLKELLIRVTNFFRDKEAFESLRKNALTNIIKDKSANYILRAWVPGCSTGEEVYSLAILFNEIMDEVDNHLQVQIFSTDIDIGAIEVAREGFFPAGISKDIPSVFLHKYFDKVKDGYVIKRYVRECVVFAPHNLIKDPPFTKMDFISCRNLLIYFEAELQKKIIPLFHYSLKPEGILFLGASETIGDFGDLFEAIDAKWRIYRRRQSPFQTHPLLDTQPATSIRLEELQSEQHEASLFQYIEKNLMAVFIPACVVINKQGTILYFFGKTGKYLEPPNGKAQLNLFKMLREELQIHLPAAIHRVLAEQMEAVYENLKVLINSDYEYINLHVRPLGPKDANASLLLVIFEESKTPPEQRQYIVSSAEMADKRTSELEKELTQTKEQLRSSIEEMETTNEELRSINEEYQSTNEELKSANEELETSREEMQSLNEELSTVNSELQVKIKDLDNLRQDMNDYLNSLEIPVIILDPELKIKHFSTRATEIINLIDSDIGRPLTHIVTNLNSFNLIDEIVKARDASQIISRKVKTRDEAVYIMRIMPLHDNNGQMARIVLSFLNVMLFESVLQHPEGIVQTKTFKKKSGIKKNGQSKKAESEKSGDYKKQADFYTDIIEQLDMPIAVLDIRLSIDLANEAFKKIFHLQDTDEAGQLLHPLLADLLQVKGGRGILPDVLNELLDTKKNITEYPLEIKTDGEVYKKYLINAQRILVRPNAEEKLLVTFFEQKM